MGMTNNQLQLVRYVAENDLQKAKQAALACCAEDTTQKNKYYVSKYRQLLTTGSLNMIELPVNISKFATMEDLTNTYMENRYYLTEDEKEVYERIRDMNEVSLELMERGIRFLNASLFYGASGCGKTELSRYIAYKLGLPYLYVNFSRMMDSYLGGTAKNLTALFQYINQQKCVVMLDELDSLAVMRKYADGGASAEVSRSTTCLLQLLDSVTNDHVIIAATNLVDDIDPAVKRRFTMVHEVRMLRAEEMEEFIVQYLTDTGFLYDRDSVHAYCQIPHTQAEIITFMVRRIAQTILKKEEKVVFLEN